LTQPDASALKQRIDSIFDAAAPRGGPGCVVGVQHGGETLFRGAYGLASLELAVPLTPRSRFRIASVSKQFTVTAVLMLAAQGRLRLGDRIHAHVPELAPLPHPVTLEQLMRNTSGLPDFLEMLRLGGVGLDARIDRAAMLRCIARNRHLNFVPGSRFLYCNSNFLLLGLVVERVAGCSLGEFLQQQVFGPLGLRDTVLDLAGDTPLPGLATPYLPDGSGGWRRAMHGFEHGGEGGLVSSVDDLLAWTLALNRPTPGRLPAGLLQQLASQTRLIGGQASPYACGLEHSVVDGQSAIGHGGLWPGFRTELLQVPHSELSVVVISNNGASNPYRLAREVVRALLAPSAAVPAPPAVDGLAGTWLCGETPALVELGLQGGELCATQWGVPFVLQPQTDGRWLPLRGAYEFALRRGAGDTLRVELGAGQEAVFTRLPERALPPPDMAGRYRSEDLDAEWDIELAEAGWAVRVSGPHARGVSWTLHGLTADLVEVRGFSAGMPFAQLARLQRDATGRVASLLVHSSRIRALRFERL
jgi:CubicO group peptidase (beta-lactamase class C family)